MGVGVLAAVRVRGRLHHDRLPTRHAGLQAQAACTFETAVFGS